MNGRAVAPPAIMFIIGVSTCTPQDKAQVIEGQGRNITMRASTYSEGHGAMNPCEEALHVYCWDKSVKHPWGNCERVRASRKPRESKNLLMKEMMRVRVSKMPRTWLFMIRSRYRCRYLVSCSPVPKCQPQQCTWRATQTCGLRRHV